MLSIIVSSYQIDYFNQFSENVHITIGEDFVYEIIQIWNPGKMGICEAYNKGAEQAQYDNLLFVHEDVLFETMNWGKMLYNHLQNDKIGCVGLAGCSVKTIFPIAWWKLQGNIYLNLNQYVDNTLTNEYRIDECKKTILLDGVFLGVRKKVWENIKFNEKLLKGFHGYDIDFSINTSKIYQNIIINDIVLSHFSGGSPSKDWFTALIKVYQDNPIQLKVLESIKYDDIKAIELFLRYLRDFDFSKKEKRKYFFSLYRPYNYTIKDNIRILKMYNFYC